MMYVLFMVESYYNRNTASYHENVSHLGVYDDEAKAMAAAESYKTSESYKDYMKFVEENYAEYSQSFEWESFQLNVLPCGTEV